MVKKNLFSKVLSGVLALGMVATMLPAMSLTSEAAAGKVKFWQDEIPTATIYQYPADADLELLETPWMLTPLPTTAATAIDVDVSKGAKFVLVPNDYYEYNGAPLVWATPDSGAAHGWATAMSAGNSKYPKENEEDNSRRSYIINIPSTAFTQSDLAADYLAGTATPIALKASAADLIEVTITVNVGENVTARQESVLPKDENVNIVASSKTWRVSYDPNTERYLVNGKEWITEPGDIHDKSTAWKFDGKTYGSEIVVSARNDAKTRGMTWSVFNGYGYETDTSGVNYKKNDLVDLISYKYDDKGANISAAWTNASGAVEGVTGGYSAIAKYMGKTTALDGFRAKGFASKERDFTSYIGLLHMNNTYINSDVDQTWMPKKDAPTTYYDFKEIQDKTDPKEFITAAQNKAVLPDDIDENIMFTINPEDIYRLYVFGPAQQERTTEGNDAALTVPTSWVAGTSPTFNYKDLTTATVDGQAIGASLAAVRGDSQHAKVRTKIGTATALGDASTNAPTDTADGWFDVPESKAWRDNNYKTDGTYDWKTFRDTVTNQKNIDGFRLRQAGEGKLSELRYGPYKNIVINLGTNTTARDAQIKIQNGDQITDNITLTNVYKYEYVIRDKDGNRFDHQNGSVRSYESLSSEPVEYPYDPIAWPGTRWYQANETYFKGYKEGDVFEFQVRLDKNFAAGDNFSIKAMGWDDRMVAGGAGGYPEDVEVTAVEGQEGVYQCKYTIGERSPYRIVVNGVEEKKKVRVYNIPEDDSIFEGAHLENVLPLTNRFYGYVPFLSTADGNIQTTPGETATGAGNNSCNVANPRYQLFVAANEEDEGLIDLMAFARPGAVGTGVDWIGHEFPVGTHKFRIRFNDEFVNQAEDILHQNATENQPYMHGTFDNDRTDDRYGKGPDFKVLVNDKEVSVAEDDTFSVDVADVTTIKVEGVVRKFYVRMPLLNGFDVELPADIEQQREEYLREATYDREQGDNTYRGNYFRSAVIEGGTYKFKLNADDPNSSLPEVKAGSTVLVPDAEGWYSFVVRDDTLISVEGMGVNAAFNDISNLTDEEKAAIDWLLANGMTVGDGDGHFMPQSNTRRGDFVLMLYRYYGEPAATGNGGFSDVAADAYYANAVAWGSGKGIINGYPDGTFRPNNIITRAEVANILCKLCGLTSSSTNPFVDVNAGDWFFTPVTRCFAAGIVNGTTQTTFTPNAGIIRAHYALMLYRSHSLLPAK